MAITAADVARVRKEREQNRNSQAPLEGKWQAGDVAKVRRESAAARAGGFAQRRELDDELYTRRTGRPAAGTMPNRTRMIDEDEPGGLLGQLGSLLQRSTELQNRTAYRNEEIRREAEEVLGRPARENEARYNAYNQWLEEGDNRRRLNDLVQSEQAARKEADIDERMHKLGYTDGEIEEIRARRREYQQSVPFGYDITHRIASSVEGIASQAAGAAFMAPETLRQALYNFADRQRLNTGDESHDELLKAVERVRNSNGMYTLDELARNNDRGWTAADIAAAEAELDGAAAPVDMSGPGGRLYQRGEEALQEARLGLSDLQELAYGAAESAGENIALGLVSPGLLLGEQALRSAGGGIADSAAAGQSAGQSLLSGLGHGAVSAGIEQIGIGQMMRNMGRATGMSRVTDDILDRIAALPGMDRLAPSVAGIVANAGEEAAEEFAQTYADTAVDALLGRETPGLLSGELLGEAAQSALGGAVGGGLIGGISSGIGAVQDVRQGRIAPRADLVANANLSATIEQAGQIGRAQQAAAGTAQAQQEQQAAAQVQQAALEAAAESATTAPQQRTVDPQLAELAAQSGGRLDASAWRTMQQPQAENAESLTGNAESLTAQDQRQAVRQNWTDEQRAEAMLLEANTSMTEAAVNTAVEAMPADVSGDVYSVAANTVYQLSRQGIAEDWDAALDLASRSGVRVNQILAAPGGAEALQMIYNRGQMDGIEASGYSAAGLADERRAGQVQYQPGALVPEEDKMLFDLYAAASDTAVTVSDRLEKNAGGYVDTALGKVYFGAEAGADTFGMILHESVHQYNAWDEAGGRALQTATLRYLAEQQGFESVNDLVERYIQRYQEAGQELSYAQACEEITADAMRGVFGSEETFARWVEHQRALAEQNGRQRSTIAKVMDHVREMLDKVISKAKSILNREPGNAAARQAQALAESQKRALEELYYKHAETAMEAQRAARRSQDQTENVNKSEESANENQTGVASSQQNVASSQQNVASERRYQFPDKDHVVVPGNGNPYMNNKSYRSVSSGKNPISAYTGYAMFADNANAIADVYGEDMYMVDHKNLVDIDDFKVKIAQAWDDAAENGTLPAELDVISNEYDGEAVAQDFDPPDIVDGAGAWDNPDITAWAFDAGIFEDVAGVKTRDGAVVWDPDVIIRVNKDAEVWGTESGESTTGGRRYQLPVESDEERASRRLANLSAELDDLNRQRRALREEREAWEKSEDVQKLNAEKEAAKKHGLFSAEYKAFQQTPQYQSWVENRKALNARATELEKRMGEVQDRVREVYGQLKAIKSAKNNDARASYDEAAERNGGKATYRRTLAVERFGTTEQFERAGYILPDGQMLDFAQNDSTRDTDHREIIDVFGPSEVKTGTEALNAFLADGNIRVMAEAPGIDVSAEVRPSAEQLERIREMAETIGAERRGFTLDFSAADGKAVASKTYRGRINADRIVREIREYYQTGTLPEESNLAQFRYRLPVDEGQMESGQRAAAWENVDRAGLLEALQAAYEEKETHRVPEETIDRIARRIVSGEDSRADVKVVREQLVGLLNYAASGQADWDAVVAAAEGIADEVMKKSGHMDRSLWNEYKDLHYFTVKVKRGGTEYNELVYRYGSYAAAKREMARFGITLNTNEKNVARGIDQVYQELAGDYPGLFSAELTDPMEQLDRIAQVRQAIKPAYQNSYGESYEEARADLAMRIIGSAVAEGVTDTGVAGMLRQRIDENLNAHRAGVQRRVVNALNEQERTARDDAFRQMQRVVSASGEANRRRLEAEREAWAKTSDQMRTAMARSRDTAQRARDARNADNIRRQIAANRTKLNRMLLHPSDQYHVPPKLMQDALQVAELANNATYNEDTVTKLQALRSQLAEQAAANEGADSIAADWNSSGISEMLGSLASSMQRTSRRNARLDEQADAQARRLERGLNQLYDMQSEYENADFSSRRIDRFTVDELATLRDITSAMVTVIQNSNKLLATQTAQSAAEFASVARQEVEGSPSRLKDKNGKGGSIKERLLEFYNKYRANVYNAERIFNMLGGHRHGGAMEALGKSLAAGEAKQTAIREKGMQQFRDVLEGKENRKLLRRFAGQDAELIDVGFSTKINRAQMVSLYMHLQNAQNREHVLKGGVVIPDMKEYARGHIEKAYRTNRVERITEGTISAIEKELTTGEMADYCQKWITDLKELLNNYTKNVINETSRRLSGYDKAGVGDYYPIAVDRDVLQKEIEGVVYNGTIEGRGFLKSRQEHSKAPLLLEEASGVMARTLADAAAYGGLAPAIRDANKIWNANRNEQGSLRAAVRKNFGSDGVNFVENYIADLQQRPRTRKNIFDFLSGMRGNYAGAVLTLNPGVALGQVSGVAAAASDLGWKATWDAYREMLPNSAEHKERIRKEMMDHGYWQLEATLSDGPTAELNAVRQRSGAVQRVLERIPGTGWLENMDMKTRMALWEGSKYYVDHHLEEFGLPADAHGSDAWWGAVVSKMTEVNDRTQPNYTISQQSALQRDPSQLVKMLTMFRSQGFQNYGLVASAVEDVRAQAAYEEEYAQRAADTTLGEEERQQAQADLERVQRDKAAAWTTLRRAASGQVVSAAIFVAAKMLVDDWLLHRYDREKDEEGQITPASVAGRAAGMIAENLMGNVYGLSEVWNTVANLFGGGEEEPVSLTGVDAISDLSGDLLRLHNAVTEDELDPTKVRDRLIDLAGSVGNLTGVPVARLTRIVEGLTGWIGDISTAANSDGLNLWDVMNAPPSSTSQYDRLYTAVFEEPDPEDAAAALKRLADLDELTPPAKASNAKAGDSKLLTELLKREREYGSSVQDAAAARVAGNEAQQRQIRQELVNTLAGALGIDQNTKEGQRRLRTVINKVDGAITDEVREQMGADSKTGATVYTPLLAALEDGGDPAAAQTVLRRAGITDSNIKSAVQGVYKDEYIYSDESTRQRIERQLLQLKDANGEPYFDESELQGWVTDWELQGLNDSVYTDLDEALATGNKAAAKEQIDRYMMAGKSADSIRNRMASLYKQEYINADSARRREIAQFLVGLRGPKGEKIITVDTLTKWIMDDAMAKATAGR